MITDEQIRKLQCSFCDKPAACIGRYDLDDGDPDELGCDECCGHGCEDGACHQLLEDDDEVTTDAHTRARCAALLTSPTGATP